MTNLFITKQNSLLFSIYVGGIISYNIFTIYSSGSEQLIEYRKTKQTFKTEIESIVVGVQKNWFDNLLLSFFWPIRLPLKIVPILILNLNSDVKEYTNVKEDVVESNTEEKPKENIIDEKFLPFDFSAKH